MSRLGAQGLSVSVVEARYQLARRLEGCRVFGGEREGLVLGDQIQVLSAQL